MEFQESVKVCFKKYADFSGRATLSEYWWFALFLFAGTALTSVISHFLYIVFALGTFIPAISAATRRLHDTNRSGWWQLILLIPLFGFLILIYFLAQETKE